MSLKNLIFGQAFLYEALIVAAWNILQLEVKKCDFFDIMSTRFPKLIRFQLNKRK